MLYSSKVKYNKKMKTGQRENSLEFPQNYPHWEKLLRPVIHNFQKMPKI